MKRLVLFFVIGWFPWPGVAGTVQREYSASSTGSWAVVSSVPSSKVWRALIVRNSTDGDVQIAFGSTDYPDFTVPEGSSMTISNPNDNGREDYSGALYIRNSTGVGGTVTFTLIDNKSKMFQISTASSASSGAATPVTLNGDVKETKYLDASSTQINDSAAAWVAVGSVTGQSISGVHVTTTIGEPLEFGLSTDACATTTRKWIVNRGEGPLVLGVTIPSGNQVCVRSLTTNDVTSGEIVLNLGAP